ncbi:MAG: hypothetical protein V1827_00165 [Candidatus Micrarchaeota archaeon]
MAKIRILRKQDKAYIELPAGLAGNDEIELFSLRDGYYLLSVPLGQAESKKGAIDERERAVLRKLLSIRFENRTPAYVSKALSGVEMEVLGDLEKKGMVNVFKGDKYKDGVYNINDSIYPLLAQKDGPPAQKAEAPRKPEPAGRPVPADAQQGSGGAIVSLRSRGFVVIADRREAMMLSEQLGSEMKSGAFVGVKGFDGKFYIVSRNYFNSAQSSIGSALKEDMDAPSVAAAAKLDPEGCLAVLRLMAENGEIIEKKRGVFAPV